ncbi:hypothetical protein ABBQ38_000195 [Trebouxia sp. C0009 RCD-2024]
MLNAVLKVLAEERLEQFADQVQTRILEGKQARVSGSHAGNQQDKYDSFLHTHEETFQAFLEHSGLADKFVVQQLADKGTDAHVNCDTKIHASDAQLEKGCQEDGCFCGHAE